MRALLIVLLALALPAEESDSAATGETGEQPAEMPPEASGPAQPAESDGEESSEEERLPALLERLRRAAEREPRLRIRFRQRKELALLAEPIEHEGLIEIDRTRQALRWEFTGRSLLILGDGELRRWNAAGERESLLPGPATRSLRAQMTALLSGDWQQLAEDFRIAAPDARRLRFVPRREALRELITRLELEVDEAGRPRRLELHGAGADRTSYVFDEAERPDTFAAGRFDGP